MLGQRRFFAITAFVLSATSFAACGTDATGTDACRKIEQARCRKAPSCPALGLPAGQAVEECAQFARDRCLHGLAVADPGPPTVDACVATITETASCDFVARPELAPECGFLKPPAAEVADAAGEEAAYEAASTLIDGAIAE